MLFRSFVSEVARSKGSSVLLSLLLIPELLLLIMFRKLSKAYLSVKLLKLALPELVLVSVLGLALVFPAFSLFLKLTEGFPDISQWSSWSTQFRV